MKSWPAPDLPRLSGHGPQLRLRNRRTGVLEDVQVSDGKATLYVCGITPYDATHLGHAATYVTFDIVHRVLLDQGHEVSYTQNVTDVDDPLIERAERDGIEWTALAQREIELFHTDMAALRNLPPQHYIGVVETMDRHVAVITRLVEAQAAYAVPVPAGESVKDGAVDYYLDLATQPSFGVESGWNRDEMLAVYADRGGDPDRAGKRDALDPLLWRAERPSEPAWEGGTLGWGRPGWHVECTTIALDHLGMGFTLQGGGTDLIFPHHEMSAVQAVALTGEQPFAQHYAHQAMVGYDGEKMSKSKGNLVKVSQLRREGVDARIVRLALLGHHYATDWEWFDSELPDATRRLESWTAAVSDAGDAGADVLIDRVRTALADDLDTPAAIAAVDEWVANSTAGQGDSHQVRSMLDALLGLLLD